MLFSKKNWKIDQPGSPFGHIWVGIGVKKAQNSGRGEGGTKVANKVANTVATKVATKLATKVATKTANK